MRGKGGRRWGTGRLLAAAVCGVFASVQLPGCQTKLSRRECELLVDRYVELLLQSRNPDASLAERIRLQAEARARAARDPRFGRCGERISRRAYECAMQEANSADELERCLL